MGEETAATDTSTAATGTAVWSARVVALLIDSWVITTVVGLVTGQWANGLWISAPGDGATSELTAVGVWWYLGMSLTMLTAQAYTGWTAGKALLGIRVVGEATRRPIGLVGTLGRSFVHIVDGFLMIGYLRPLWHPQRQTFADSAMDTLVVRASVWDRVRGLRDDGGTIRASADV